MTKKEFNDIFDKLFPINRSILGKGYRESIKIIQDFIPFKIIKFNSLDKVFDWKIPMEWVINSAHILSPQGKKIIDFKENNLHVIGYSSPVKRKIKLEDLKDHLYTQEDLKEAIPYVTSYYKKNWGFCMSFNQYLKLENGYYDCYCWSIT